MAEVVVPELGDDLDEVIQSQLGAFARHRIVTVAVDGLLDALRRAPLTLSTMGHGLDDDAAYFLAAAAAGRHVGSLLRSGS